MKQKSLRIDANTYFAVVNRSGLGIYLSDYTRQVIKEVIAGKFPYMNIKCEKVTFTYTGENMNIRIPFILQHYAMDKNSFPNLLEKSYTKIISRDTSGYARFFESKECKSLFGDKKPRRWSGTINFETSEIILDLLPRNTGAAIYRQSFAGENADTTFKFELSGSNIYATLYQKLFRDFKYNKYKNPSLKGFDFDKETQTIEMTIIDSDTKRDNVIIHENENAYSSCKIFALDKLVGLHEPDTIDRHSIRQGIDSFKEFLAEITENGEKSMYATSNIDEDTNTIYITFDRVNEVRYSRTSSKEENVINDNSYPNEFLYPKKEDCTLEELESWKEFILRKYANALKEFSEVVNKQFK